MSKKFFKFFFFFLSLKFLSAQTTELTFENYTTEHIKIEKGLSQNTIFSIYQDSFGYIWFGTWDGLNRYDGYDFKIYKASEPSFNQNLSNEIILAITEDKYKRLLIGTENGLNILNRRNNELKIFQHTQFNSHSISSDTVQCFAKDHLQQLWIGTHFGLNIFDAEQEIFEKFWLNTIDKDFVRNNNIKCIYIDSLRNLWVGTENGLFQLDYMKRNIKKHYNCRSQSLFPSDTVTAIACDRLGNLWVGTERGVCCIHSKTGRILEQTKKMFTEAGVPAVPVYAICKDKFNRLWFGTFGNGVYIFDLSKKKILKANNNPYESNQLSNDYVYCLYEDKDGSMWVGTWKGANKNNVNKYDFQHIKQNSKTHQQSLSNNTIWSFAFDKQEKLWIATDEGINIYDNKKGTFEYLQYNANHKNTLASNKTRTVVIDKNNEAWIGTLSAGVCRYNIQTKQFTHYIYHPNYTNGLSNNSILSSMVDSDNNVWFGTWGGGACRYNAKNGTWSVFKINDEFNSGLNNNIIWSLYEDPQKRIWVGTDDGLYLYNKTYNSFKVFRDPSNAINANRIFAIFLDSRGLLWIGTLGNGLNVYDEKKGLFKNFNVKDGLANNIVYDIIEDNQGNLWMTTNYGISQFVFDKKIFINFDVRDGLQGNEFNIGATIVSAQGEVFMGGMNGFNSFFPEQIHKDDRIPVVQITQVKLLKTDLYKEHLHNDTIIIPYDSNTFLIKFAAVNTIHPNKIRYAYRLYPLEKEWNYVEPTQRQAEYNFLRPGKYVFQVKASNAYGVWNEDNTQINVIIYPPWWQTWTFLILSALGIIAVLSWMLYSYIRRIQRKHHIEMKMLQIQKQLFELEQSSLRLQINPHFIFNTLNSIQNFILKADTDKAVSYLAKFAQLMRLILTNTRESIIPLSEEIKALDFYLELEKLRFDNKFQYTISIENNIDPEFIGIPPMILQPFIENAILHGILNKPNEGNIKIEIEKQNNFLFCKIKDDGIGRDAAAAIKQKKGIKHQSRGIQISQQRLELLSVEEKKPESYIEIIDLKGKFGESCGTQVNVKIPFVEL